MPDHRHVPTVLLIVAILFLLSGIGSAIDVLLSLFRGDLNFNFGVLGIPIFFGLRAFSSGWRTCALVLLWIGLAAGALAFIGGLFGAGQASATWFGVTIGKIHPFWVSLIAAPAIALIVWQIHVLTRPDIRRMFYA